MELILKCDTCERVAHNPSFNGRECGKRSFDGKFCRGTLKPTTPEEDEPDPHLECDICGRRADLMTLVDKVCDWTLPDRRHCQGILREVE